MKRLIFITLLILMMIFSGCVIKGTIDGFEDKITNIETVPNPFFTGTKVDKTLAEIIVELTTLMTEKSTTREVEQTTRTAKPTILQINSDMVGIINNYRKESNLNSLKISDELCKIAEVRAEEASLMWSHTRPNGLGIDSLINKNIEWTIAGENLVKFKNATSKEIVDAWMQSETHRANLLNPRYRLCGISEYYDGKIRYMSIILTD